MRVQSITFRSPVTLGKAAVYSVRSGDDCRIHLGAGGLVVVQQRTGKAWTQHAVHLAGHPGVVLQLEDATETQPELDLDRDLVTSVNSVQQGRRKR